MKQHWMLKGVPSIISKADIIFSESYDPWYNLALEEYILDKVKEGDVKLYLWQNENTVVIGRNQNAWKECHCRLLEEEGGKLARRLSGGGAVYHDLGNLNFTFLLGRELYDLKKQLGVILKAVKNLGIEAEFSGRNDLIVRDRKFSGNAFYFSQDAAYHHGTIMVDTNFKKLVKYLHVSREKIKSKGIDSVRSRVINLNEINPDLTIENIEKSMVNGFREVYGKKENIIHLNPETFSEIEDLYHKYSSWEWRFGQTPEFDITFENRFNWGNIEIGFKTTEGYIEETTVYSDAMQADLIEDIGRSLEGVPFVIENIIKVIDEIPVSKNKQIIVDDIKEWLEEKFM